MKKVALVFLLAVFAPSLVLAWLAVHSLRDQQFLLERQQSILCQGFADASVQAIQKHLVERQNGFAAWVEEFMANRAPRAAAIEFDERLREAHALAEVGFVSTLEGEFLCPSPSSSPMASLFCLDNGAFLGNREIAQVYMNGGFATMNQVDGKPGKEMAMVQSQSQSQPQQGGVAPQNFGVFPDDGASPGDPAQGNYLRKVSPKNLKEAALPENPSEGQQAISKVIPAETDFRQLVGEASDGMLARYLRNKLSLMFWHRLEREPQYVFGAQIKVSELVEGVKAMGMGLPDHPLRGEICVALLDENAKPVLVSNPGFSADWKRPFVASEIGEALPHWELAVYLLDPGRLTQAAQTARLSLGALIGVLLLAIGVGSWLIVLDVNRQLRLTRQKTDFVSNVSHELKTPLTSIRMFSELLAEGRVQDPEKQRSYLQIIAAESGRLTRLINNVLDFARLERGEKKYRFQDLELTGLITETVATLRPHLESRGFKIEFRAPETPVAVRGDRDALSQVVMNLLSNAEKYSDGVKEIAIELERRTDPVRHVEIHILDRGSGVPPGCEDKIFEQFYRAHDSLDSGIQGSGLGLTLARQIARAHGGDVLYRPRDGGGSRFVVALPCEGNVNGGRV